MTHVFDASVVLKWYLPEEQSDRALVLRKSLFQRENIAHNTELLFFETTNK